MSKQVYVAHIINRSNIADYYEIFDSFAKAFEYLIGNLTGFGCLWENNQEEHMRKFLNDGEYLDDIYKIYIEEKQLK